MTLQEIKDQVAKEFSRSINWYIFKGHEGAAIDEIAKRYATECVKASLERAAESADGYADEDVHGNTFATIIKSSITDPKNIVLL